MTGGSSWLAEPENTVTYTSRRAAAEGMANDEIAASLDARREAVSLWRKRFFADRLAGLEEHARPGRPRTFPPDLVVQVKALACELPATHGIPLSSVVGIRIWCGMLLRWC